MKRVGRRPVDSAGSRRASRRWWDADAVEYQAEHGRFLGDAEFMWCPEGLSESRARLLGEVAGLRVLEVGCGAAACSRWLAAAGARPVAFDLSGGMLAQARAGNTRTGIGVPLVQADAEALPFADASFDAAISAFGAVPFVADPGRVMREVYRVLRPGGRWAFSVTHPMRWMFLDDPTERGLVVVHSYFDRTPYVEYDDRGVPSYVEHHRTLGDRVRDLVAAGFVIRDIIEPTWQAGEATWGQWSRLRGEMFPGTAIFVADKPSSVTA